MTRRPLAATALALTLGILTAAPALGQDAPAPPQATPRAEPLAVPTGDGTGVRLVTEKGDILIYLFNESAPVASENFLNLASSGYYDGVVFHRLVPGFVIQGGDPEGTGFGGPGYTIPDETVVGRYGRGVVAMARTGEPNSAGSQFFIVLDDAAEGALAAYNTYVIFGQVAEGMDVVDAIAAGPTDGDTALEPVKIVSADVEEVAQPPLPSLAPAPVAGDPDLEARVPAEIAGNPVERQSYNGDEIASGYAPDDPRLAELQGILATLGAEVADLSVANGYVALGEEEYASIFVIRLAGATGAAVLDVLVPYILGTDAIERTTETVGGREVTVLSYADGDRPTKAYIAVSGEDVFLLDAQGTLLEPAVTALPS